MVPNSPLSIVLITAFEFFFSNSFNNTNYTNLPLTNRTEQNRERGREREREIRTSLYFDRSIVSIYYYFLLLIYIFRNIELFHIWTQRAEIHRGKVSP